MDNVDYAELTDHFVLFCDFLGFREKVSKPEAMQDLLQALQSLARMAGDFEIEKRIEKGVEYAQYRPSVSAFSDHVVISSPLSAHADQRFPLTAPMMGIHLWVGEVARIAWENGMLIRGGLTVGPLYHKAGVIFGRGLVEAHELESTVANYPRIAISPRLFNFIPSDLRAPPLFYTGVDGIEELNYFKSFRDSSIGMSVKGGWLVWRSGERFKRPEHEAHEREWIQNVRKRAEEEIAKLDAQGELRTASKWRWFLNAFNGRIIDRIPED